MKYFFFPLLKTRHRMRTKKSGANAVKRVNAAKKSRVRDVKNVKNATARPKRKPGSRTANYSKIRLSAVGENRRDSKGKLGQTEHLLFRFVI